MLTPDGKKAINNFFLIFRLAPLIQGQAAADLATAASAYRGILTDFNIAPSLDGFDGCKQAMMLTEWWIAGGEGDDALMEEWTDAIKASIADIVAGKVPNKN